MSEINKINSGGSFDVRINQPSPERREKKETTVNEEQSSQKQNTPPKPLPKKPPPEKTRESSAMEDMLEALREQQVQEDIGEYIDRRKEFYRESNRQASEAYIRNQKETRKEQTKEVVKEGEDKDVHATYHNRIQDISRAHIQKLMKQKLEGSTLEDVKRTVDPDAPNQEEAAKKSPLTSGRVDNSRLRPEVARILERRQQEEAEREAGQRPMDSQAEAETQEEQPGQGRSLLESAIGKLKNRLGGAHKGMAAAQTSQFSPGLSSEAAYRRTETPAPIRADLNEVQASITRARSLRAAADGSQYLPLEDGDVNKLLLEHKLPVEYGTVQAIKQISRQLKDSSYYFLTAVAVQVHAGLPVDAYTTDVIRDSLKQFEKYQRQSIMNKLYRFLITKKNMQVYQQLLAQESYRNPGAQPELGEALYQSGGSLGNTRGNTGATGMAARAQAQVRMVALPGQASSPKADENLLKAHIQGLLKELGLPASKVMVNQLSQSAQGSPLRAQALVFQLAAGKSLHPDEITVLQEGLEAMSPDELQSSPRSLMEKLGLPVKQLKASGENLINSLMRQLGVTSRQTEAVPLSREAILLLHELGERTDTVSELLPRLAEQVRKQPELWLKRLAEHQPRIQQFIDAKPHPLAPEQKHMLVNTLMLALELPAVRPRAMNRVAEQLARQNLIEVVPTEVRNAEPDLALAAGEASETAVGPQANKPSQAQSAPSSSGLASPASSQNQGLSQTPNQTPNPLSPQTQNPTPLGAQAQPSPAMPGSQTMPNASTVPNSVGTTGSAVPASAASEPNQPVASDSDLLSADMAQGSRSASLGASAASASQAVSSAAIPPELSELFNLPAWTPERQQAFPTAREAVLLLHLQAERTDQVSQLMPRLSRLLEQAPDTTMRQLERLNPALQDWSRNPSPKPETLHYLLHQLEQAAGSQLNKTDAKTTVNLSTAPFALPEHPLDAVLQRHYPGLSAKGRELASQQLQGASPALMDGFYQLHRLLGMLEPGKGQALTQLWEQPQIYARLARLGPALAPVLEAISLSPERRYLTPPTQQNQLVQAIQTWLLQGRPEALQSALQQWLEPLNNMRNPLGKVKEQLAGFGVQNLPENQLEEIWAQSGGNADAVDAMAMLLKGGLPLVSRNVQTVLQYIEHLPPAWRRQGVSDILLHLSPQLLKLIDSELEGGSALSRLSTLLGEDLPLLPENWEHVSARAGLPDFAANLQIGELRQQLAVFRTSAGLNPAAIKDLEALDALLQKLQVQMRSLPQNAPGPADLKALADLCRQILELRPQSQKAESGSLAQQSPTQSWMQLLQPQGTKGQPVLLQQVQDQFSGLFYQLKTILPKLETRTELPIKTVTPKPELLPNSPEQFIDPNLQNIRQHLERWGIQVQSPEMMQQILTLMEGSHDRLDAMAVLLKSSMPLIPAHVEIVSQYVRKLPPSERFTSISKILSFLSDELLVRMKQDLSTRSETQQQQMFPDLDPEEAKQARQMLQDSQQAPSEARLQASRLLPNLPLPQSQGSLQAVTHLLTGKHQPQHWIGSVQQLLGQMQSLLQGTEAPPAQAEAIAQIQELLAEAMPLLQPKSNQLGSWMMGVGSQLADVSSRISEQVNRLGRSSDSENWVLVLLQSLLGISSWLEDQEPHKREQIRRYRSQLREQMPAIRQSFESLSLLHGMESQTLQATQNPAQQPASQYLPALIQSLGYPVEMLVRNEGEDSHSKGRKETEVQLTIQTHTLGQIYLSMQFSGSQLRIRAGLERRELQRWIQPYLEALQQKLGDLPWSVASVQTYVVVNEQAGAPVLAHHLHKRYGRSAIEKL